MVKTAETTFAAIITTTLSRSDLQIEYIQRQISISDLLNFFLLFCSIGYFLNTFRFMNEKPLWAKIEIGRSGLSATQTLE